MECIVSFEHQANQLSGSLYLPDSLTSSTVIIMLQGSGASNRHNDTFFPPIRQFFLNLGIAVYSYDKPGVGQSTGNWQQQSFEDRAHEALAAVDKMTQIIKTDGLKVGLFGHSQGGWIVFLTASMSDKIDFIISNSGPSISPTKQDEYGLIQLNQNRGESEETIQIAVNLYNQLVDAAYHDQNFTVVQDLIGQHKNSAWDHYFSFDKNAWKFFKKIFDYDPIPALKGTQCHALILLAEADLLVPVAECESIFRDNLDSSISHLHTFPDANHRMKVGPHNHFAPDYFEVLRSWLLKLNLTK
ncbi:MAG: alpha/beta hydrolase [Chloroflexota bacterium]